jgi:hypothetical protein
LPSSSVSFISGLNSQAALGQIPDEPAAGPQRATVGRLVTVHDDVRVVVGHRVHTPEHVLEHVEGVFRPIHMGHATLHLPVEPLLGSAGVVSSHRDFHHQTRCQNAGLSTPAWFAAQGS